MNIISTIGLNSLNLLKASDCMKRTSLSLFCSLNNRLESIFRKNTQKTLKFTSKLERRKVKLLKRRKFKKLRKGLNSFINKKLKNKSCKWICIVILKDTFTMESCFFIFININKWSLFKKTYPKKAKKLFKRKNWRT